MRHATVISGKLPFDTGDVQHLDKSLCLAYLNPYVLEVNFAVLMNVI